jgi:hypothetical protein
MKRFYVIVFATLFIFVMVSPMGRAFGVEQPGSHRTTDKIPGHTRGSNAGFSETGLLSQPWLPADDDIWTDDSDQLFFLTEAEKEAEGKEESLSPECIEWRKDPDSDIGEMLRAGCQPTIGQMSALMDNPLGNVAMLFTQFDFTRLENPTFDEKDWKYNYMGIAQFPKGLGENWNIINRVVWNVPSMPIDQGKVDDSADRLERQLGSGEGSIVFSPNTEAAPIDLFSGSTTGFGDMYYVGLFSPKKGYKLERGGSMLWGLGFDLGFPTATEDILGTGKWTAGPSGLGVYLGPKWKIGAVGSAILGLCGRQRP